MRVLDVVERLRGFQVGDQVRPRPSHPSTRYNRTWMTGRRWTVQQVTPSCLIIEAADARPWNLMLVLPGEVELERLHDQ